MAESVAVGRRIVQVRCAPDPIVYEGTTPETAQAHLLGRRVDAVRRWGKLLWMELDALPWPSFHFGMTGAFRTQGREPLPLAHGPAPDDGEWPPRFWKLELALDDGGRLAMTNARRLGRIRMHSDIQPVLDRMGFDPLLGLPRLDRFRALLARRSGPIKAVLLDQSFAAGVGNWLADEILYQARISPHRKTRALDPDAQKRLHQAIRKVVRTAVEADAVADRFPKTWLFHHRWDKVRDRTTGVTTARGESVRFDTVGGRTTAWVPARQR